MNPNYLPDDIVITDEVGRPKSMVDVAQLQSDATRLMYAMAVTAGDDAATDRVGEEWAGRYDPDYFGYLAAGALSLMTRCILGPVLEGVHVDDAIVRIGGWVPGISQK